MATDKEYLAFCNASNLEFQFCFIDNNIYDKSLNTYRFPYISELLKPDNFAKRI